MQRLVGTSLEPSGSARVVPVVASHGSPVAAAALAAALGVPAALLVFLIAAFALAEPARAAPGRGFALSALLAGWAACTWLLARRTARLGVVLRRALLLGAVQWVLLAPLVGSLPDSDLPLAAARLREGLGLPLRVPNEPEALFLAALCLLAALALAALRTLLSPEAEEPERAESR